MNTVNHPGRWIGLSICLLGLAATPRLAAESGTPAESLTGWRYFVEVPLPPQPDAAAKWWDVVLTPQVFDGASLNLPDLRLYDAQHHEVQYALRIRRPEHVRVEVPAEEFNRVPGPENSRQVSLDLGENAGEHNEVEVLTTGTNYRRAVLLEGSDDRQQWSQLAAKNLLRFEGERELTDRIIRYDPPSRFRYLRLSLHPDPVVDREPVEIGQVHVRRRVEVPGEYVKRPVTYTDRDPVPADGGPGSSWTIDLGGNSVPCERLLVQVADPEFARDYHIEAAGPPESEQPFYRLGGGTWRRRAGEKPQDLVAVFPEVSAARLRLVVTDHRNEPLRIEGMQVEAAARTVIGANTSLAAGPLRLYFGNPKAAAPKYDFESNLPPRLQPAPARLSLGQREDNPDYQPELLPLTERLPWLIYILLSVAVAILGVLILNLARAAIALEDARQAASPSA